MASAEIPPDVAHLLTTTITSATQLEVLLFLHAHPLAEWNGRAIAEVLGIDVHVADAVLSRLHGQGFLSVREQPSLLYQFSPTERLKETVDHLARVCVERKFAVLSLLVANQRTESLRQFSDAFLFRPVRRPDKREP